MAALVGRATLLAQGFYKAAVVVVVVVALATV
jgi:hypothetical protein